MASRHRSATALAGISALSVRDRSSQGGGLSGPCPQLIVELGSQCPHLVLCHEALGRLVLCRTLDFEALKKLLQLCPIKLPVEGAGLLVGKVLVETQTLFDLLQVGKVIRRQNLPLND